MIEIFAGVLAAFIVHDALHWAARAYERRAMTRFFGSGGYWRVDQRDRNILSDLRRFRDSFHHRRPFTTW